MSPPPKPACSARPRCSRRRRRRHIAAPALGTSWTDDAELNGMTLKEGRGRRRQDQVVIDKAHRRQQRLQGRRPDRTSSPTTGTFRIVGLVGLGDTDGFGGATIAAFDPPVAQQILGADGKWDAIDVRSPTAPTSTRREGRRRSRCSAAHRGRHRRAGRRGERPDSINDHHRLRHRPADLRLHHGASWRRSSSTTCSASRSGNALRELALMRGIGASRSRSDG